MAKQVKDYKRLVAGCCLLCAASIAGSTVFKNIAPYSGIIGWSLGVIFLVGAVFFLAKAMNRKANN